MEWLSWIRGTAGMGLMWAAVWAVVGALIRIVDRGGSMDRLWLGPAIGMAPGFLGGVMFSAVLGVAASRRRLDEVPISKAVACGGMAGLLVGVLPFAINQPTNEAPLWLVGLVVIGSMALLGVASATGALALARRAEGSRRKTP